MAYDEFLAGRVDDILKDEKGMTCRKMFGGLCFMINGNMCVGVDKNSLMVRVGKENYESALKLKHAKEMDFTGKPLRGFVYVGPEGLKTQKALEKWVKIGVDFAGSLPKK